MDLTEQAITDITKEQSPRGKKLRQLIVNAAKNMGIDIGKRVEDAKRIEAEGNAKLEHARRVRMLVDDDCWSPLKGWETE